MSRLSRCVLLAVCALLLAVTPAAASDATDAYKKARTLAKTVDRAGTDEARAAAEKELKAYVDRKVDALSGQELTKMDTAYLGRLQGVGGRFRDAVVTLKKAIDHRGRTKYLSSIYNFYVKALIQAGDFDDAFAMFNQMAKEFEGDKNTKITAMSMGLALRGQKRWKDSASALDVALKLKNPSALKPLVNSLLLDGRKPDAIKAIEWAIDTAGEAGADPGHQVLLAITKKIGETIDLEFDAYAPGPAPNLTGKVVVMGAWNVSAGTLRWTMEALKSIFDEFPPVQDVVTLAVSTYYKKNPDTGMFEDDMSPATEREIGISYAKQHQFEGQLAYTIDREALQALGVSALPFIAIVGKDGKLLFAHVMNRHDPTDLELVRDIIRKAKE